MNMDLEKFVRDALAAGIAREKIRAELARGGWPADEIDAALAAWLESDFVVPVPRRRVGMSAREAFVYLVLFATLYLVAFQSGAIAFALIERWVPDPVSGRSWDPWRSVLRWGASALLIGFPVYLFASRVIARSLARDPEKRNSGVRRWLTYLTLFVAALVLIGDLVWVVSSMLSGELATRFMLKAGVVFAIAGVVFGHYLGGLRRDEEQPAGHAAHAWFGRIGAVGVLVSLALALFMVGSPELARTRELDQRRVRELAALVEHLRQYRRTTGTLPSTLPEAQRVPYAPSDMAIVDPVTGVPYSYAIEDSVTVLLGATFARRDSLGPYGDGSSVFWAHPQGAHVFRFSVKDGSVAVPIEAYRN